MPRPRNPENSDLPNRWRRSRNAFYYQIPREHQHLWGGKQQVKLGQTLEEAHAAFASMIGNSDPIEMCRLRNEVSARAVSKNRWGQLHHYDETCGIPIGFLQGMYQRSRTGASARGLDFDLIPTDMATLAMRAAGRCELSGITWDFQSRSLRGKRPWSPSLDRIDSMQGYSLENCRLVAVAVNIALSDFGEEILRKIAIGIATKAKVE